MIMSASSNTAYMCNLSYKNKRIVLNVQMEHLRCTMHNAEKYWHCNLGVFMDDAPVCKMFTVDFYLILLFCLTCNHFTKLSENNSLVISCPTVLGHSFNFAPKQNQFMFLPHFLALLEHEVLPV